MSSVKRYERRTQASASVWYTFFPFKEGYLLTQTIGQVGKVLGEKWKALNPKERGPYEAKAKADKERYETEKASYNVSTTSSSATQLAQGLS